MTEEIGSRSVWASLKVVDEGIEIARNENSGYISAFQSDGGDMLVAVGSYDWAELRLYAERDPERVFHLPRSFFESAAVVVNEDVLSELMALSRGVAEVGEKLAVDEMIGRWKRGARERLSSGGQGAALGELKVSSDEYEWLDLVWRMFWREYCKRNLRTIRDIAEELGQVWRIRKAQQRNRIWWVVQDNQIFVDRWEVKAYLDAHPGDE